MGSQERGRFSDLHVVINQGGNLIERDKICSPNHPDVYFAAPICFWNECWELHEGFAARAEHLRMLGALE